MPIKGTGFIRGNKYAYGENVADTGDILFANAKTDMMNGDYAAGSDSSVKGILFLACKSFLVLRVKKIITTMINSNILEGREGDDILVASIVKDVFFYQTNNTNDTNVLKFTFKQLDYDTIHSFE